MAPAVAAAPAAAPKLLSDIATHSKHIPSQYIRPASDRPNLSHTGNTSVCKVSIPVIDLSNVGGSSHCRVVEAVGAACRDYGFFQVKNHGIPESSVEGMLAEARKFFHLPESERLKSYSDDPKKTTRLSTSFNVRTEKVANWRDYLRLHCYPLQDFIHEWPSNPPNFREAVGSYSTYARKLSLLLLSLISESLGLERDFMEKALGKQAQHMAINYYPPCPQPELTYGLPGHKDPNAVTVLLQDGVSGLQVRCKNNGRWINVQPEAGTLIVNIGDQVQALSNGIYESVLHRVIVNSTMERISVPTFYCPAMDTVIQPAEKLVHQELPAKYRRFTYGEYFDKFWNRGLETDSCLDLFPPDGTN